MAIDVVLVTTIEVGGDVMDFAISLAVFLLVVVTGSAVVMARGLVSMVCSVIEMP